MAAAIVHTPSPALTHAAPLTTAEAVRGPAHTLPPLSLLQAAAAADFSAHAHVAYGAASFITQSMLLLLLLLLKERRRFTFGAGSCGADVFMSHVVCQVRAPRAGLSDTPHRSSNSVEESRATLEARAEVAYVRVRACGDTVRVRPPSSRARVSYRGDASSRRQ